MGDEQELPAFPIRAYQLIPDPNQPTVVALAIETDQGHSLFLATREILEATGWPSISMPATAKALKIELRVERGLDQESNRMVNRYHAD